MKHLTQARCTEIALSWMTDRASATAIYRPSRSSLTIPAHRQTPPSCCRTLVVIEDPAAHLTEVLVRLEPAADAPAEIQSSDLMLLLNYRHLVRLAVQS